MHMRRKKPVAQRKLPMVRKRKAPVKSRVEKPYNSGTMSKAMFFGMIRSALRQKSRWWKPILKVKEAAKVPYFGPNKRRKFSYICSECLLEFDAKAVNVHHKEDCGSLNCFEDIGGFCERLFCSEDGLILLCNTCHDNKHPKKKKNG